MRVWHLVLAGLLLVGCSDQQPEMPALAQAQQERASEIEAMLRDMVAAEGQVFAAGCYPPRFLGTYDLSHLANMAMTAAQMEQTGWEIVCASYAEAGDSYGAVNPQTGMVFECPVSPGLLVAMRRGSIADGTAECAVVQ